MQRRQQSFKVSTSVKNQEPSAKAPRRRKGLKSYLLVPLFLPFGDQIAIRVAILEQPVVKWFADRFFFVVEVVDVP